MYAMLCYAMALVIVIILKGALKKEEEKKTQNYTDFVKRELLKMINRKMTVDKGLFLLLFS